MADLIATLNTKDIDIIFGAHIISGFGDNKVQISRETDAFDDEVGCDGEVTRYATNDKRGTITVYLLQSSKSNLFLSTQVKIDEATGAGVLPCVVKNNSGNDLYVAAQAWARKVPDITYLRGVATIEWKIRTSNLQSFIGGS